MRTSDLTANVDLEDENTGPFSLVAIGGVNCKWFRILEYSMHKGEDQLPFATFHLRNKPWGSPIV